MADETIACTGTEASSRFIRQSPNGVSRQFVGEQMEKQIVIESPDGTFRAYISRPASLPAPAVIVLDEVFGVNADIRATCDELAAQNFIAIAPDLFWRQETGVDLDVTSEADWQHGLRLYAAFDRDAGARDATKLTILETRSRLESDPHSSHSAAQTYCYRRSVAKAARWSRYARKRT
jgi:dienelactone hydrolase